jgi:predicted nicotinamide N-methyase
MAMSDHIRPPALFAGAVDYKLDPSALEAAQATFNEEGLYAVIERFAGDWYARHQRPARVLDLCSASGLTALRVSHTIPVKQTTLVDNEPTALEKAAKNFEGRDGVEMYCADAVTYQDGRVYDLVLLNSAYHHIEHDRKHAFLTNASAFLAEGGCMAVGDHFLPEYTTPQQFRESVLAFYAPLLKELEERGEPPAAIAVIKKAAYYTWAGDYEYKTSWAKTCKWMPPSLRVATRERVWAPPEADDDVGTIALRLERDGSPFPTYTARH